MSYSAILWCISLVVQGSFSQNLDKDQLKHGLEDSLSTGNKPEKLLELLGSLQIFELLLNSNTQSDISAGTLCAICEVTAGLVINARRSGVEKEQIGGLATNLCVWMKLQSENICKSLVEINVGIFDYIIVNRKNLTSERVCSIILQNKGCKDPARKDWSIKIPPHQNVNVVPRNPSLANPLKVLHLTDIHYDPDYEVGANAACEDPLCCQAGSKPASPADAAGVWGDYRSCDLPWIVINDSLGQIVSQRGKIDYAYYTGDIVHHNVWETNITRNSEAISKVSRLLRTHFGSLQIFPILGNHEPHPVNVFSSDGVNQTELSTQWVFDLVAEEWKYWLPPETRNTILRGGYYTVLVRPGFRVIALNNNVCYTFNWWLLYDDVDPYGQLEWLVGVLLEAERNNEAVHILSHIPTADDTCLQNWAKEYTKIVNRFANTIAAQFNGHTHREEHMVYFNSSNPNQALSVAFNGGSLTTFSHVNPNYVIYDVDQTTLEVLDFDVWVYNLTDANLTPNLSPRWFKQYSFKNAYGVASLRPADMALLAEKIAGNRSLAKQYTRYRHREADTALARGCDDNCYRKNICYMVTAYYGDTLHCQRLTKIWESTASDN